MLNMYCRPHKYLFSGFEVLYALKPFFSLEESIVRSEGHGKVQHIYPLVRLSHDLEWTLFGSQGPHPDFIQLSNKYCLCLIAVPRVICIQLLGDLLGKGSKQNKNGKLSTFGG